MKTKIFRFLSECLVTAAKSPVETGLAVYLFVTSALFKEDVLSQSQYDGWLVPIFFSLAYLCNRIFRNGPWRSLYYLCGAGILPFLGIDTHRWLESVAYYVSVIISILAVPASMRIRDNDRFVSRLLGYAGDMATALLLSGVAWLLFLAIFFSASYIFNIFHSVSTDVTIYSSMTFFMLVCPLIFLTLDRKREALSVETARLDGILIDYVLTPALLIYTVVLYLYFAVITVTWTLPKGGIAYMVFAFTILAMTVKALVPLTRRRFCSRYYERFSYISLPALTMFWIGVLYRVAQYGFTESRVYLTLCGAIMSLSLILFLFPKTARYHYIVVLTVCILALFTYIPGLTARAIGIRSQTERAGEAIRKLGLASPDGRLIRKKRPTDDTLYKEEYRKLYESLRYLDRELEAQEFSARYGINSAYDFAREIVPRRLEYYVRNDRAVSIDEAGEPDGTRREVPLYRNDSIPFDIGGYGKMYRLCGYRSDDAPYYYSCEKDSLYIKTVRGDTLLRESFRTILSRQLQDSPYTTSGFIPADTLQAMSGRLLEYETDSLKILFDHAQLQRDPELSYSLLSPGFLLFR